MKKTILSMMLAIALCGGVAVAQTPDANTGATKQNQECCQDSNSGKTKQKDGKHKKDGKGNKFNKEGRGFNPFDGIQLTNDQQQRLQVLQQGLGPVRLDKAQQERIPENPNLTPEQKKQLKSEKKAQKQAAKKKYLNGVKEVLTPEQYVIFLENCYLFTPENQGTPGMKHNKKDGFQGKKDRGERKQAPGVTKE
ncbi:MAG: hypothetical protein J1F12_06705 [Muribaculaceae bacterium]|nr:hypothetical protein [Muribaculaceae bacterium]